MDIASKLPPHLQLKVLGMLEDKLFSAATGITPAAELEPAGPSISQKYIKKCNSRFSAAAAIKALKENGVAVFDKVFGMEVAKGARRDAERLHEEGKMRAAGMGRGETAWTESRARGDEILWMNSDLKSDAGTGEVLVDVVKRMHTVAKNVWAEVCPSHELEKSAYQLARYAGGGARYVRHSDVSEKCAHRRITAIYYMNPDWKPEDGGCLRIFTGPDVDGGIDVAPLGDRLVLFLSDIEHEVLPSHQLRLALSGWLYSPEPVRPALDVWGQRTAEDTIFVTVPSYRDSEAQHTIVNMFEQAARPDLLYVGLISQCDLEVKEEYFTKRDGIMESNVREVRVHWSEARGPCWARYLAQKLYQGERYYLQIDSHMRFAKDWDTFLISELRACPSDKPILSSYPPGYKRTGDSSVVPRAARPTVMCASHFGSEGMLRLVGKELSQQIDTPVDGLFWAAGFSFSNADVITHVPYDPHLKFLFFGEEVSMASRFFTHGYDLFAPSKAVVFHLWSRSHRPTFHSTVPDKYNLRNVSLNKVRRQIRCGPAIVSSTPNEGCDAAEDKTEHGGAELRPPDADDQEGRLAASTDLPTAVGFDPIHVNCSALCDELKERIAERDDAEDATRGITAEDDIGGMYGLGTVRTLEEWMELCGVDFENGIVSERTKRGGLDSDVLATST